MVFRALSRLRKKQKPKDSSPIITEKSLGGILRQELNDYIKREDLDEYVKSIQRDKRKREIWDSLPPSKKLKLLRYVAQKKGGASERKKTFWEAIRPRRRE